MEWCWLHSTAIVYMEGAQRRGDGCMGERRASKGARAHCFRTSLTDPREPAPEPGGPPDAPEGRVERPQQRYPRPTARPLGLEGVPEVAAAGDDVVLRAGRRDVIGREGAAVPDEEEGVDPPGCGRGRGGAVGNAGRARVGMNAKPSELRNVVGDIGTGVPPSSVCRHEHITINNVVGDGCQSILTGR